MIYTLTARTLLMIAEGASLKDAVEWVIRRLPRNLLAYYRMQVVGTLVAEGLL